MINIQFVAPKCKKKFNQQNLIDVYFQVHLKNDKSEENEHKAAIGCFTVIIIFIIVAAVLAGLGF